MLEPIRDQVNKFLDGKTTFGRRGWFHSPADQTKPHIIKVYLRRGRVAIHGSLQDTITLANVDVDEQYQRRGLFKTLEKYLMHAGKKRHYKYIVMENVLNIGLATHLFNKGYRQYDDLSLYKRIS